MLNGIDLANSLNFKHLNKNTNQINDICESSDTDSVTGIDTGSTLLCNLSPKRA